MPETRRSNSGNTIPPTRAGAVAEMIRERILSGEFAGGTRLRQNEIAEMFGVSSTPVREAFLVLAREGLLRQDTHRGVVVFSASEDDVRENYEIRIALETLAARLAAKNITKDELDRLDSLLEEMADALQNDLSRQNTVLNPAFHALINEAARRPRLAEMIAGTRQAAVSFQSLLATPDVTPEYLAAVQAEHEEIVAALRARAPKRAAAAVQVHIEHNMNQVLDGLQRRRETRHGAA